MKTLCGYISFTIVFLAILVLCGIITVSPMNPNAGPDKVNLCGMTYGIDGKRANDLINKCKNIKKKNQNTTG